MVEQSKLVKLDNVLLDQSTFDKLVERCQALGCDISDYMDQALTFAMANEEEKNEDR